MTTENSKPPAKPGMSEVSPKFVDEAAATTRIAQDAINAVLDKIPPRSGDETQIAHIYRKLLAMRAGRPRDLSDDDMAMWVDEHDHMEEAIGRLEARNTQDVDIKLAVLCDRLREAEAGDLLIAQAARDDLKKLLMAPSPASAADNALMALVVDYYAAYIARDAADGAREEASNKAAEADSEAAHIKDSPLTPGGVYLSLVFDHAGTLTPTREQVSQYSNAFAPADKHTEAVMRHLEEYGERCVAAFEVAGWPEKQAEFERAVQRRKALFDQMVQTPAQGLRGIAAKVKGLVYPHEWEFLRDGELDDFDDQINTDMLVSLVADVERLTGEGADTKRQTSTTTAASSGHDPAAQIGHDLAAVWRQVEWNDENRPPDGASAEQKNRFKHLDFYLTDRWAALEAMAAEIQAGSLEGAMIQIMLAHAEADLMMASTEESSEAQMRTISKLLYSVLRVLEQGAGVPREKLGGEHYMCRDLDPHALVAGDEIEGTA